MAAALEFKRRVRALPDLPPSRVRERRTPVMGLGLVGWALAVCVGLGIDRGYLPVKAWAAELESPRPGEWAPGDAPAELEAPTWEPAPDRASMIAASPPAAHEAPPEQPSSEETSRLDLSALGQAREAGSGVPSAIIEGPSAGNAGPEPHSSRKPERLEELVSRAPRVADRITPPHPAPEPEPEPAAEDERVTSFDRRTRGDARPPQEKPPAESGTSCEVAIAANEERIVMGQRTAPDLSREQFAGVLEDGRWFEHCAVSPRVGLDVCVAVKHGRAVGVTVQTRPRDRGAERCVAAAARRLSFPSHERLDVTHTTFSPE